MCKLRGEFPRPRLASVICPLPTFVSIRQRLCLHVHHTSAYVSIDLPGEHVASQHTSEYVSIRQHRFGQVRIGSEKPARRACLWSATLQLVLHTDRMCRARFETSNCIRLHTSACVSIRECMSAYVSIHECWKQVIALACSHIHYFSQHTSVYVSIRQHTSAYVSVCQRTSAYMSVGNRSLHSPALTYITSVSIRQYTSAYVSIRQHT